MKRKLIATAIAVAMGLGGAVALASPASAHVPNITASCDGVHLSATAYDGSKANTWEVNIGGVEQSGTFGSTYDHVFPVPQAGATTHWSATIQAYNGTYKDAESGDVGPCGTAPTPKDATAAITVTPATCDADGSAAWTGVNNATTSVLDQTVGDHNGTATATQDHAFSDGSATLTVPYTIPAQKHDLSCFPPVVCTATGSPYSEDTAPTVTADGDLYSGGGGAVDKYWPVTGNMQGITSQSITFADVHGYQPSLTLVVNPNGAVSVADGGSGAVLHYANIVAEWYQNGGTFDTAGTFTVTQSTLFWTNKIANPHPGSQSDPQPLTFFENLFPANSLISLGGHLGSANPESTHSLVTALSGCVNANTVPVKPDPVYSQTVVTGDTVCSTDGGGSYDTTTTYYVQNWTFVDGQYVLGDKVLDSSHEPNPVVVTTQVGTDVCPQIVTPLGPTQQEACGTANDKVILPADTDVVSYDTVWDGHSSATVTATPKDGVAFPEEAQTVWTFKFDTTACPIPVVPVSSQQLATTGIDTLPYGVAAAVLLLLSGGTVTSSNQQHPRGAI